MKKSFYSKTAQSGRMAGFCLRVQGCTQSSFSHLKIPSFGNCSSCSGAIQAPQLLSLPPSSFSLLPEVCVWVGLALLCPCLFPHTGSLGPLPTTAAGHVEALSCRLQVLYPPVPQSPGPHGCMVDPRDARVSPFSWFKSHRPNFGVLREGPASPANPVLFPSQADQTAPPPAAMLTFTVHVPLCPLVPLEVTLASLTHSWCKASSASLTGGREICRQVPLCLQCFPWPLPHSAAHASIKNTTQ